MKPRWSRTRAISMPTRRAARVVLRPEAPSTGPISAQKSHVPVCGKPPRERMLKGFIMNKDQVAGRIDKAKGKVKQVAGKVTGSEKLKDEGTVDEAAGTVQSTYGDTKEKAKDLIKSGARKL